VIVDGVPYAVDEIVDAYDTPDMISVINDRFPKLYHGRVTVYPDASGKNRSTNNASVSGLNLLKGAGFFVDAPLTNPPVKDRVLAMNNKFLNSAGESSYFVNTATCQQYVESLEQQIFNGAGSPDKTAGFDHCFAGDTMITCRDGEKRIDEIRVGDSVLTRQGFRNVYSAGLTGSIDATEYIFHFVDRSVVIVATPDHKILTNGKEWKEIQNVRKEDRITLLCSTGASTKNTPVQCTTQRERANCTATRSRNGSVKSRKGFTFTTLTGTLTMLIRKIWNVCRRPNTEKGMTPTNQRTGNANKCERITAPEYLKRRQLGTNPTPEDRKRESNMRRSDGSHCTKRRSDLAKIAGNNTKRNQQKNAFFVRANASRRTVAVRVLTTLSDLATLAVKNIQRTNIHRKNIVHGFANQKVLLIETRNVGVIPVFDLSVEQNHEFVANGIVVHNCNDSAGYFIHRLFPVDGVKYGRIVRKW